MAQFLTFYIAQTGSVVATETQSAPTQTPAVPNGDTHEESSTGGGETQATTEADSHGAAPAGGLGAIGIDGRALAFQLVNFVILFWILKKVAYKPVLGMLEERRKRIEDGLRLAKEAEAAQAEAEATKAKLIADARVEAAAVLAASRDEATEMVRAAEAKATARADQIVHEATERTEREAAAVRGELRKELGGLVAAATKTLIEDKLDDPKDAALIEKALRQAEKSA